MTINEAITQRRAAVRKPTWNPTARLELPMLDADGLHGLWATLRDSGEVVPVLVSVADDGKSDWEPVATTH